MKREYKNSSAGKACGGVCDKCGNPSEFLFNGLGLFCTRCSERMAPIVLQSHKLMVKKDNIFLFEYCSVCHRRDKVMWKINFGFCKECLNKVSKKETANRSENQSTTKRLISKYNERFRIRGI